jgi:hypothetical protein
MKFPKKVNYMLILLLMAVALLIRYPRMPHESGVDSFVMHGLANSISLNGNALWILNPLSWFGMYPLSYPSGGLFLVSGFSQLSAMTIEGTAFFTCMLLGIIGILGAVLLGREILDNDLFVFLFAFIFTLTPRFVVFTLWEIPTRSLFMAFTPFFIWALLRTHRNPSKKNIGFLILFLFILATAHRLVVMVLIIILAYILTYIFLMFMRILRLRFPTFMLKKSFRNYVPTISIILLFLTVGGLVIASGILEQYEVGALISGTELHVRLINLGISLARSSGLLLPFIILGSIFLAKRRNKELKEPFLIFTLVALIPTLFLRGYTGFYIVTFISIFTSLGILYLYLLAPKHKKTMKVVVTTFLVISIGFTSFMIDYQLERVYPLSSETYSSGLYLKDMEPSGTTITNNGIMGSKMASLSGDPYLPVGGATTSYHGPEMLAYGFEKPNELNIVQTPLQDLTIESDSPFQILNVNAEYDWAITLGTEVDQVSKRMITKYGLKYAMEDKVFPGQYFAYNNVYTSYFLLEAQDTRYKLYDSDTQRLWYIYAY